MFQVRIHGRGGQGVVTAAEMLSVAAFLEGRYAQAFPSFGSERTGAPVVAFCRIDEREIRLREPVREPDALIIQRTRRCCTRWTCSAAWRATATC
jgi:pyruvate ferredoxin oxidoreductase gamma subunit